MILLTACTASGPLVTESLDPETAVTITRQSEPFIFFRKISGFSDDDTEFAYAGAFRVNRMGSHSYYLWVSAWGPIQGDDNPNPLSSADSITLSVDTDVMELPLHGRSPASIGASTPPYPRQARGAADAYFVVSPEQLGRLAESMELRIEAGASADTGYAPWNNHARSRESLQAFLDLVRLR